MRSSRVLDPGALLRCTLGTSRYALGTIRCAVQISMGSCGATLRGHHPAEGATKSADAAASLHPGGWLELTIPRSGQSVADNVLSVMPSAAFVAGTVRGGNVTAARTAAALDGIRALRPWFARTSVIAMPTPAEYAHTRLEPSEPSDPRTLDGQLRLRQQPSAAAVALLLLTRAVPIAMQPAA